MIVVELPHHLRALANVGKQVVVQVGGGATQRELLDALEAGYPVLRGTIRDPATGRRRPFVRFFAGGEDLSHEVPEAALPPAVVSGAEPFVIVGAMAGG